MRRTNELGNDRELTTVRRRFPFGYYNIGLEQSMGIWLEADSLLGTLVDNDPISTVTDLTGHGFDYGAAGTARPTFKTNIVNGYPVMRFATNDVLTPTGSAYTYGENNTVIVVCTERTSGSGYIFSGNQAFGGVPEGGPAFITGFSSKDFEYFARSGGERQTFATTAAAGFHILTLVREDGGVLGETFQGYIDGALAFSTSVIGNDNWSGATLAKIGDFSAGDFYNGDIVVLAAARRCLTLGQLNRIHHGLGVKYGIAVRMN